MYLWVNVADLDYMGNLGPLGSPLNLMIRHDLGDTLLPGAVFSPKRVDDIFVIVECTQERAEAIQGALEVMAKAKIRRKIRTNITAKPPNSTWKTTGG